MTSLTDLHRAVQDTIASKRLGRAVFVRYTLQGTDKPGVPLLATLVATVRDWLSQPLVRLYAVGTLESGQVSLTLHFRDGATALVSYALGMPRGNGVDLIVVGNRGAMYHDAGSASFWDEAALREGPKDATMQAAIERALRSGKPELVAAEGQP